jgi:hypothetical protein
MKVQISSSRIIKAVDGALTYKTVVYGLGLFWAPLVSGRVLYSASRRVCP